MFAPNELNKNCKLPRAKLHKIFLSTELDKTFKKINKENI